MRFPLLIARRYLLSRRLPTAVNVITWVAMLGIFVVSAALIVVLSVFNGFGGLLEELYGAFDPDIRIEAAQGRIIANADSLITLTRQTPGIHAATQVVEGRALIQLEDRQQIVLLKGISIAEFTQVSDAPMLVIAGEFSVRPRRELQSLVVGSGVAFRLSAYLMDYDHPITLYTLTQSADLAAAGDQALRHEQGVVSGIFTLHKEYDDQFVLADMVMARRLLEMPTGASAIEVRLTPEADREATLRTLTERLGPGLKVLNANEQHATLYRIMENEKAVGYWVLTLMMMLTAVNILGGLAMIVMEKRGDISMLVSLGADSSKIRNIFLMNGLLVGGISGILGLGLGVGLVWSQDKFHWLKLAGGDHFVIDHFPVRLVGTDILYVGLTVIVLALLASWYPATRAARQANRPGGQSF